jgi:hypothetical protein
MMSFLYCQIEIRTIVYENSTESKERGGGITSTNTGIISEQSNISKFIPPLTLVCVTYAIIAGIPVAVAAIVILYRKGKI